MRIGTRKSLRQLLVSGPVVSQSIILSAVLAVSLTISSFTGSSAVIRMKSEFAWKGLLAGIVLALVEVSIFRLLQKRFPRLADNSLRLENGNTTETEESGLKHSATDNTQAIEGWKVNEKSRVDLLFRALWFLRAVIVLIVIEDFFFRSFLFPLTEKHLSYWAFLVYALMIMTFNFARTGLFRQFVLVAEAAILLLLFRQTHSFFFLVVLRASLELTKLPLLEISWHREFQRIIDNLNSSIARLGNFKISNKQ